MTAQPRFADLARAALEKHVPEATAPGAAFGARVNEAWVRFPLDDGRHAYLALRRHLDWVTGEFGLAATPAPFERLEPVLEESDEHFAGAAPAGGRIRLGVLLHGDDRWWRAEEGDALVERLEWIVLQLRVKAERFLHLPVEGA